MSESNQVATVNNDPMLAILQAAGVVVAAPQGDDVNRISIEGKVWRYKIDGEFTTVQKEVEGEKVDAAMVDAIILGHAETRAYGMFEGGYTPGKSMAPVCFSNDATTPDKSVVNPKSASCKGCPMRAKGSANSTENPEARACRESRMIAVTLKDDPTHTPLQFRLAIGSLWQADDVSAKTEADGWYSFESYAISTKKKPSHLSKFGIAHECLVQTKMKFGSGVGSTVLFKLVDPDPSSSDPRRFMHSRAAKKPDGSTYDLLLKVAEIAGSAEVKKLLNREVKVENTPAAIEAPASVAQVESKPEVAPVQTAPASVAPAEKPKAAVKSAPKVEEASTTVADQLSDW